MRPTAQRSQRVAHPVAQVTSRRRDSRNVAQQHSHRSLVAVLRTVGLHALQAFLRLLRSLRNARTVAEGLEGRTIVDRTPAPICNGARAATATLSTIGTIGVVQDCRGKQRPQARC